MENNALTGQRRFVVPHIVATHFHLREGDAAADLGSGMGYFVPTLAHLVGPEGRVYACEIQKQLVEKVGNMARSQGLANVQPLWGDLETVEGSKIPPQSLDAAIMVNTFFQLEDKEQSMREVVRVLRPGGKFFLLDWQESFGGLGPLPEQVVGKDEAISLVEASGLVYEREFDAGDHHYGLGFRRV